MLSKSSTLFFRASNAWKAGCVICTVTRNRSSTKTGISNGNVVHVPSDVVTAQKKVCQYCNATIFEKNELPVFPRQLDTHLLEELLPNVDAFIFDADGVLWLGNVVIPGSPQFIQHLLTKGKRVIVLTNNSSRSRSYLADKLQRLGFLGLAEENIVNPAAVIIDLLEQIKYPIQKSVYLIGSDGLHEELTKAGIICFGHGPDPMHDKDFDDDVFLDKNAFLYRDHFKKDVGAVIVGFEKYFNYVKLIKAANYLQNENCLFLGTNEDETSPGPYEKTVIPDTGPILAAVKLASGREPLVIGKPHATAFEYISKRWKLSPERTFMVGDRLNTDIWFGKRNGLKTLLVFTGCHIMADVTLFRESGKVNMLPDYFATSLGSLIGFTKENGQLGSGFKQKYQGT